MTVTLTLCAYCTLQDWLFEVGGASEIYPDKFEKYASLIPEEERGQMIEAYYRRLTSEDEATRFEAARRFVEWELNISKVGAVLC
jgi:proline iminopeptidase